MLETPTNVYHSS